jgi:hypothetical protein
MVFSYIHSIYWRMKLAFYERQQASTSILMAPGASRTSGASVSRGTATIRGELEETRARSPMLLAGGTTKRSQGVSPAVWWANG